MLADISVLAMIAVNDIAVSKKFYGELLGLKQVNENPGSVTYQCGSSQLSVYKTTPDRAGTNKGTSAAWRTDDVEGAVAELKAKGITFEHWDDLPGITRDGDIHSQGPFKAVWFKDPDGNILSVETG